jgi:hypothetical protein
MAARKPPAPVWVSVEVLRGTQISNYRGRMTATDYRAILGGSYVLPFITLEDVHWVESALNDSRQPETVNQGYGQPGRWQWFAGPLHLRPATITTIAPLKEGYGDYYTRQNTKPD